MTLRLQRMEYWGYYVMRACCGSALKPVCCLGYGCKDSTNFLVRYTEQTQRFMFAVFQLLPSQS
jgi:hypothetical protein